MANSKLLTKNRVFGISIELDELLKLYCQRLGISLSKFVRVSLEEKLDKLNREEQNFWMEMSADKIDEIILSLMKYLDSKFSDSDSQTCEHSNIWENNDDENFMHTKKFCKGLQIELNAFLKRIETNFKKTFDCECQLYKTLKDRSNRDEK